MTQESNSKIQQTESSKEDHRTSDHEMYTASLKKSKNYKAQPYQYASSSKQILKAKANPFPPCIHYGFNDHRPDDSLYTPTLTIMTLITSKERHIRKPIWCMDSGCSRSTTGVKNYLHKYVEQPSPKVVFSDNSSCITKGYGSINCGGIVFTKVAFVNGLKYNLISISQLCDAKYIVKFNDKQGTIFNANKEIVLIAPRRNDVYDLDMTSLSPNGTCFFAKASERHSGKTNVITAEKISALTCGFWCIIPTTWGKRCKKQFLMIKKAHNGMVIPLDSQGKLIQKLLLNQKCMGYLVRAYYSISPTRHYKDDSCWSVDMKSKATEDIISIGSFLEALVLNHYRAKVTTIEESKDLTSLSLDELIGNIKVHEMIIKKDSEIIKAKVERKSLALMAKCGDPNHLIGDYPKPPKDKNQRAFVGGSWNNSGEEDDENIKYETCLVAQAPSEICLRVNLEPDEWIKDSGCSKHIMGNRKLFSTYKESNGGNVIFGSNLRDNIIGKGQICDNKCRVTFSKHDSKITKDSKVIGCTIVSIRTDHGGEFDNEVQFGEFCIANGITHNFSAPRTPQSNGVVKRKNRILQEMSRTMLNEQSLPQKFWCNAVDTSTYILNQILIKAILGKTPYELLRGRKPTLDYYRVFGSKCFILNTKDYLTKFDPKSYEGVFLGYSQNIKAYIILNKHTRKIEESLNVTFDETPPPSKTSPLVDDDLHEEEAIRATEKKILENVVEDETLEIDEIVNIKESRNHPLENVIGNLNQRTLRLVAQGYNQQKGIDYDETYAPVARLESIRILLAYACALDFKLLEMDVKSAFLNGFINEEVYVAQPPGFIDFEKPDHVYKLKKALYVLKQAPKAWYDRLKSFLVKHEYKMGMVDNTLFTKKKSSNLVIVQIYVDDIIFGSTCQDKCDEFAKIMHDEFEMSMMGKLNFFLGLQIKQIEDGIFFNQSKYIKEMLKKFGLEDSKPIKAPMSSDTKLTKDEECESVDSTKYRGMIGTTYLGLWYPKGNNIEIVVYADSDHAGDYVDRKSTSGYSFVSKAFRVFNTRRQQIEETYHVTFDESIEAIRFTNTLVDEIGIDDSFRYSPDEFLQEDDPSRQYQVNSDDTEGPPDLINTEGTHEQNVQNDQMITQPTDVSSGNNIEVSGCITGSLVPNVTQSHISNQASTSMLTRSMVAKLTTALASECLFADFLSEIEPKKVSKALKHLGWIKAMQEEHNHFYRNKVWTLVPLPYGKIPIGSKWVSRNKKDEHVARMEAIRIFLAFATYMNFKPHGFESSEFPDYVCKLDKALYGLKQVPKACSSVKTPMVPPNNLGPDLAGKPINETSYRGMTESLMYLTVTRPDIQFSIVLCFDLKGYLDSDYAGCNMDRKNTAGAYQILGGKLVCWSSKKQQSMAMSSAEAEYVAAAGCCANISWMKSLDYNNGKYVDHPTPEVLGGNYSSTKQVNSIQQLLAYCLITGTEVDIEEIIYSNLITKLMNKSRLKYVSYPRFISCALQVLLGSDYTLDENFRFLPPILSNSNCTKDTSKVTDIELTAHMIAVNNQRDLVSPHPFSA
ncbi:retrovirus-related pol polyprotein from transposon TNT 1-94 [Tanacetum coccineum]